MRIVQGYYELRRQYFHSMDEAERYDVEGEPFSWSSGRWNDMACAEEHYWVDLMTCAEYVNYYFNADNTKQCRRLLMEACARGNLSLVNMLLRYGARIDQRRTFNIGGCEEGCGILRALLSNGFRPTERTLQRLLFFAARGEGAHELARMLVALGADPDQAVHLHGDCYHLDDDVRAELAPIAAARQAAIIQQAIGSNDGPEASRRRM